MQGILYGTGGTQITYELLLGSYNPEVSGILICYNTKLLHCAVIHISYLLLIDLTCIEAEVNLNLSSFGFSVILITQIPYNIFIAQLSVKAIL